LGTLDASIKPLFLFVFLMFYGVRMAIKSVLCGKRKNQQILLAGLGVPIF
jgi:hypothetical protein